MDIATLHTLFRTHPQISTDTRKITPNSLFFALKGPQFNGNSFAEKALKLGANYAFVDEKEFAKDPKIILVDNVLNTLQELASYHREQFTIPVIALTGSNGKTTTKELFYAVLSKKYNTVATQGNLNNHIGVPLSLLRISENTEIAIIEMGANHLEEISFLCNIAKPTHGYITNFGKAHLEGFGSLEGVIKGKSELYQYLKKKQGFIFYNEDDPIQQKKLNSYKLKEAFSFHKKAFCTIESVEADPLVTLKWQNTLIKSQLMGLYNATNCCAAILCGQHFKIPASSIQKGIENYIPENNRSQIINKNGHKIILDAYNANPSSMLAALSNFNQLSENHKIVFLGDMFELGDTSYEEHKNIVSTVESMAFNTVYYIGSLFNKVKNDENFFLDFSSLKTYLNNNSLPKATILIKGSRGMALERILNEI